MPNPPIKIAQRRAALARMHIDLTLAFHATSFAPGQEPDETDANQALVAVAVMLGHADDRAMNASQIATLLRMPRTSVLRRLEMLISHGLIRRIDTKYYLDAQRAKKIPYLERFNLILAQGFAVLGPGLSEMDT